MPLVLLLDSLWLIAISRRKTQENNGAIFFLHGFGDLLISANAINLLSENLKAQGMRSFLFVEPAWVDFCERFITVDEVRPIVRKDFLRSLSYRIKVIWDIGNLFKIAIQPHYNRHTLIEDSLVRAASRNQRLGNAGGGLSISKFERWFGDPWYDQLVTLPTEPVHDLVRQQQFVERLGYKKVIKPFSFNDKHLMLDSLNKYESRLLVEPYMLVIPFSSHPMKNWPLDRFVESASAIASQFGLMVVVIGMDFVDWPEDGNKDLRVLNLSGKTPIDVLIRLVKNARIVLGNDSGVFHLSVALKTPTLIIGGGGMPVRFFPYPNEISQKSIALDSKMSCFGCGWNCIYPIKQGEPAKCMLGVSVDQVVWAAERLLTNPN
jgi:ADP-heptose:LPS heptosyltransferase